MSLIAAIALAGVAGLVLGAAVAAWPGRLGAGFALQAVATGLLGASGAAVLVGADAQGAAFRSTVDPALGLDALSGFFLGDHTELAGGLENVLPVDIRIPGCPPAPQTIAEHLLAGLDQQ